MATCFLEGSNDGTINGTSDVEMVPAPATDVRRLVRGFSISSEVATTLTVALKNGATKRVLWSGILFKKDTLQFGEDDIIVLDSTDKSLVAFLDATETTPLDFVVSWGDATG